MTEDVHKYEIMGNVNAHDYSGEELTPTPRRIEVTTGHGYKLPTRQKTEKFKPSEIIYENGKGETVRYYHEDLSFNGHAYYHIDQLDWIINCLQQLKENNMTKPKTRTITKEKVAKAVDAVLHAPGSSKAAKAAKGSALSSKAKKPTLKEQLAHWEMKHLNMQSDLLRLQREYDEYKKDSENLMIDYNVLLNESSKKDMEIANLHQELLKAQQEVNHSHLTYQSLQRTNDYLCEEIAKLTTPWYTKFINFLKGD